MTKPTTAAEAVTHNALGPKRVRVGKTEVEEFSPEELIKADVHQAAQTAASKNHMGLRFTKIVPPGAG